MAASSATVVLRGEKPMRPGSSQVESKIDLIPISVLPDKKEWIAAYDIEMLMLDGYDSLRG